MKIFFDIETVSNGMDIPEQYTDRGAFMPEFNKIICISAWYTWEQGIILKSYTWDETGILTEFFDSICKPSNSLWGFNIKWFDIPFIVKRALHHGIKIPDTLKAFWKKPWEVSGIFDIYEAYKHIGYNGANLDTVCKHLWVETSKDWIDWSQVQKFYDDGKFEDIVRYCEQDVRATIQIAEKLSALNFI